MRGIMFRPWKVAAIAASPTDRVWQTRRAIKELNQEPDRWEYMRTNADGRALFWVPANDPEPDPDKRSRLVKPRYRPGEVIYIKEAFWYPPFGHNQNQSMVAYRLVVSLNCGEEAAAKCIWKNPRTMPAWAARYFVKILKAEACRTRDITPEDCAAEGITSSVPHHIIYTWVESQEWYETPQQAFFALYDSINGAGTHERDWVWCYQFVKTARPEVEYATK